MLAADKLSLAPVLPTESDSKIAAEASRELSKNPTERLRVRLDDGTELELPQSAARLLIHLLTEIAQGNAVTIIPIHAELTTQEAADFLGVSRPFLIRLLEENQIPFHKAGTHRRVKFLDLEAFKKRFKTRQNKALDELVKQAQDLDLGY